MICRVSLIDPRMGVRRGLKFPSVRTHAGVYPPSDLASEVKAGSLFGESPFDHFAGRHVAGRGRSVDAWYFTAEHARGRSDCLRCTSIRNVGGTLRGPRRSSVTALLPTDTARSSMASSRPSTSAVTLEDWDALAPLDDRAKASVAAITEASGEIPLPKRVSRSEHETVDF